MIVLSGSLSVICGYLLEPGTTNRLWSASGSDRSCANGRFVFRVPSRRPFVFSEIGRFVPPKIKLHSLCSFACSSNIDRFVRHFPSSIAPRLGFQILDGDVTRVSVDSKTHCRLCFKCIWFMTSTHSLCRLLSSLPTLAFVSLASYQAPPLRA